MTMNQNMLRPGKVVITESSARDGIQNIKEWIPTEVKIRLLESLIACGFRRMELTSFVHPKAIPQMADADAVADAILAKYRGKVTFSALVPNLFGARKAAEKEIDDIEVVVSATDEHNMANTKQTIDQSMAAIKEMNAIKGKGRLCFSVVTAFVCPFTGPVDPQKVVRLVGEALDLGAEHICVADTTGTANPVLMEKLMTPLLKEFPGMSLGLHLHDTKGMAMANIMTALNMGIWQMDAGVGGLGGCPFTPGAAGNVATEDLVTMLEGMGIETGIDLEKILDTIDLIDTIPGARMFGHVSMPRLAQRHPCG